VLFELISAPLRAPQPTAHRQPAFGSWDQIFPDKAMTIAAIDRLVHHAVTLEMNAESYRRKAAVTRMSDQTTVKNRDDPARAQKKPDRPARDK
jgi:DNA replication protein DnaC